MFPKTFFAAFFLTAWAAGAMGPTARTTERWATSGTAVLHETYSPPAVKPAASRRRAKLAVVLNVADRLFDRLAIYPDDADHPSSLETIAWSDATGPELRIEKTLPEGSYSVLLVGESATATHLFIREKIAVAGHTVLSPTAQDLSQSHSVKVYDPTGLLIVKSEGQLLLQSPFFADGWAHGFIFSTDSSRPLVSNGVPESWNVFFQARWEAGDQSAIAIEKYAFANAPADLELGKDGYTAMQLIPKLPDPEDGFPRCIAVDVKLASGINVGSEAFTKNYKIQIAKTPLLDQATLDYVYSTEAFTPTQTDAFCRQEVKKRKFFSERVSFARQGEPVLYSSLSHQPFYYLPTVMRLANTAPALVNDDTLGRRQRHDGRVEGRFRLSDTTRQYSDFSYEKVRYELLSVDDATIVAQGESGDRRKAGEPTGLRAWLRPGNYRLTRQFTGDDAATVEQEEDFKVLPGGSAANQRQLPGFKRISWRACCGSVGFYLEPAYDDGQLASLKLELKARPQGSTDDWKIVVPQALGVSPDVFTATFSTPHPKYEVLITLENAAGDRHVLHFTNFRGGGL